MSPQREGADYVPGLTFVIFCFIHWVSFHYHLLLEESAGAIYKDLTEKLPVKEVGAFSCVLERHFRGFKKHTSGLMQLHFQSKLGFSAVYPGDDQRMHKFLRSPTLQWAAIAVLQIKNEDDIIMGWLQRTLLWLSVGLGLSLVPAAVWASATLHLDSTRLTLIWGVPFIGMLLSIAIGPLVFPHFWEHHFGKISAFWAMCFIVPYTLMHGITIATYQILHTALLEYIPFITLLFTLFTVAGGVYLKGTLTGTPIVNTTFLLVGTLVASWMGTTGASMLLIRSLIRAIENRRYKIHVIVFFIFLVSNIGGALSPLGDPPLFLGFLKGVDFFWPTFHLLLPTGVATALLLGLFFVLDSYLYSREEPPQQRDGRKGRTNEPISLEGGVNILLLAGIIGAVLMSGIWRPGIVWTLYHVEIELQNVVRDGLLLLITGLSLRLTHTENRVANGFTWGPILEVAKLFAGIFVTIIPVIIILRAGADGALAMIVESVTSKDGQPINAAYFWLTGALSSFLDNAPTYLVFFNTAGGEAKTLMGPMAATLAAISAGAVFMGANSYIGNAPNFMVRAIAEEQGIKMPSFFGYMVWSCGILVPLFLLLTFLFFLQ
ncbi:Probable transmembrane protein [invertebrate metagenome]|uniref:Probable transmembrane protein n=1 Tax=invertebrate metagenome TaxID=1711999 RepID=A0A484H4Y4_9ZZZZ